MDEQKQALLSSMFAGAAMLAAISGLLGYLPGLARVGSLGAGYIPMAPATSMLFLVQGILALRLRSPGKRLAANPAVAFLALATLAFGLLELIEPLFGPDLSGEDRLIPFLGTLNGQVPLARMSPLTGLGFFLSGLSLLFGSLAARLGRRAENAAGLLGSLVFGLALAAALGYFMGEPLLYGQGSTVPMALNTAIGFLLLGLSEIFLAGADSLPLRFFLGDSARARLMRTFVPLTTGTVLLTSVAIFRFALPLRVNPVLLSTVTALAVLFLTGVLASAASLSLGRALDRAEAAREATEKALRESEERFRAIFEQAAVGVARLDTATGRFLEVNRKYCDITGLSCERMATATFMDITHPDDLAAELANLEALKAGSIREYAMEKRYLRPDGADVWVNLTVSPLWRPGERPTRHISVVEDITERKRLEERLRTAQKLEAVGTLAGGVAHDINNVLSIILGNADLGKSDPRLPGPARELLEEIGKASLRGRDVVRQLLSFSRISMGSRKPVLLPPLVEEALGLLRASLPINIRIESEMEADTRPISADATQIHQMLINLCTNAAHAMEEEGGVLRVRVREEMLSPEQAAEKGLPAAGRHLALEIEDTGDGMDEDVRRRIFDPYFTTKAQGKGTGLGLFVVQGIVRNHQGAIAVASAPGRGTRFTIHFPATDRAVEEEPSEPAQPRRGSERILCVDDEPALLAILARMLRSLGYRVTAAGQSPEALELVAADPGAFDLVITDLAMPGLTGDVLMEKIRALRQDLPMILCTGYMDTIREEAARRMGASRLVRKPLDLVGLSRLVRDVLEEK